MVFDVLADGDDSRSPRAAGRRAAQRLERHCCAMPPDGRSNQRNRRLTARRMLERARKGGWEGVIAKRSIGAPMCPAAAHATGSSSSCSTAPNSSIGGFTEPRRTRPTSAPFCSATSTTTGRAAYVGSHRRRLQSRRACARCASVSTARAEARRHSPKTPRTNERAHWVTPRVVVEVKFAEWTADGQLRQPIFLGVRDDKDARDVHAKRESIQ